MTTSQSPLRVLKAQADAIAKSLKAAERGEVTDPRMAQSIAQARARGFIKFGVAMDDKFISIELPWSVAAETSETALAEMILKHMRGQREH